ncbi:single-stranded DNA-binding protein [Lacticaseibacillus paracasei]|uniref:single-stranded DNA-binding protein n=1 Tax=Lacticaseibacillus paracasei TaxID=1597 RepID=UPI000BC34181|nr:single-stranded DNA-binding protein [Lacticaseibacillus paracasei]ATG99301.1 single-stranded DNA-binding protein [Lacticaseibacillus paracasei]RND77140.1 Helix-destabilizing protein [Lacticaseibacillus paracasei]RND84249.1 Helix-destabilizing protein [Lacticaseibacillus paracasei]
MLNSVSLTGRLTRDVDLRYTQSGTAVGSFTLAVDRQFRSSNGERETDFISCVIWRKSAENFANFTKKGSLVGVEGHIQTRTYDNAQGQKVFVTEVIVDNFALLESRQASQNSPKSQQMANASATETTNTSQTTPNASRANTTDPFANNGQPIDIQDDDLPF